MNAQNDTYHAKVAADAQQSLSVTICHQTYVATTASMCDGYSTDSTNI